MIVVVMALVPIESPILALFATDIKLYRVSMYQASKPDGVDILIRKMALITRSNKFSEMNRISDRQAMAYQRLPAIEGMVQ